MKFPLSLALAAALPFAACNSPEGKAGDNDKTAASTANVNMQTASFELDRVP